LHQIIDISTNGRHLSRDRGFLKVSEGGAEIGRTPLDQITAVIVHAHGTTWSTSLLTELAERGAPVVLCASNHTPKSVLLPIEGHGLQGARMRAQWRAKTPFIKQAWKKIVISKVLMQAAALESIVEISTPLIKMQRKITSGDSTNIEAQAARYYWPRIMGSSFRRDLGAGDENALLNYGYTVLRAAAARAVVAAGLHPTIGLFHSNRGNAFALADDLMEPFRPLVDCTVRNIVYSRGSEIDAQAKQSLASLIAVDVPLRDGVSPVSVALTKLATSLGQSFETGKLELALLTPPSPDVLKGLGG
jgi:CRISP-associated protein Cas1